MCSGFVYGYGAIEAEFSVRVCEAVKCEAEVVVAVCESYARVECVCGGVDDASVYCDSGVAAGDDVEVAEASSVRCCGYE